MRNKIIHLVYYAGIVALSILLFYYGFQFNTQSNLNKVVAKKGVLDLSDWSMDETPMVQLAGEWEFYWDTLMLTFPVDSSVAKPINYMYLPAVWNNHVINGEKLPSMGYATYRLRVKVPEKGYYGIKIKEMNCAYKLIINQSISVTAGMVGTNTLVEVASWKRNVRYFNTDTNQIELVLQISNFHHRKGGPEDVIILGRGRDVYYSKLFYNGLSYFILGVILVMAFYHLVLYLFRSVEKSNLIFALSNFFLAIRLATTGEEILLDIFPQMPWGLAIRLEYLSYMLPVPLFYAFFRELYKQDFPKKWLNIIWTFTLLITIIVLFTPARVFSYTPIFFQILLALTCFYLLVKMINLTIQGKENAGILLGGYLLFFIIILNDIMYYNHMVNTSYLIHVGMFVVIFTQAFAIANKSAIAFGNVEALSQKLEEHNLNLEQIVEERTQRLDQQKKLLLRQSEELMQANEDLKRLGKFKQDMTGMLIHDLKNPLSVIINASSSNDLARHKNSIHEAGSVMLNLVLNVLDIHKYEDSEMTLNLQKVNISRIIRKAFLETEYSARKKNIHFAVKSSADYEVNVDYEIITRVLVNLITNAIRFSPLNETILIKLEEANNSIILHVLDHGEGVKPGEERHIFQKYVSGDSNVNKENYSTGLGLAFCQLAIHSHGGEIGVNTQQSAGADFWFKLPYDEKSGELSPIETVGDSRDVNLNIAEFQQIKPLVVQLRNMSIYRVSDILSVLNKIESFRLNALESWLIRMKDAVENCNETEFQNLLKSL